MLFLPYYTEKYPKNHYRGENTVEIQKKKYFEFMVNFKTEWPIDNLTWRGENLFKNFRLIQNHKQPKI